MITSSTRYDLTSNPTWTSSRTEIPTKSNMQHAFSAHGTIPGTQHRGRHRWPFWWSGFETYRETQIPVWMTLRPSQKKCKICIATRTENSMVGMQCMTDFLQAADDPVRVYTNRIKANWRAAGRLQQDNKNLFKIGWSRLQPGLMFNIKALIRNNENFDSMENISDRAADSVVKLDGTQPQLQQPHQQQKYSG